MKTNTKTLIPFHILVFSILSLTAFGQNEIKPIKGYTPQIGTMISMLEDLKGRVTYDLDKATQKETDFLLDDQANSIGAMIYHLAATEKYYQIFTFENRVFNEEEEKTWGVALSLGDNARDQIKNKPMSYYLAIWDEVRKETLKLLKTKDDKWFQSKVKGRGLNNHWAWYHVMEHQANHMGQIRLIMKRVK